MESARTNSRRGDSRAQSPLESSSDELATGSDHDEAERRRTSFTIQKNLTPQRPNHQKRRYRESESSDELAVDAGEYWRSSRSHQRSPSPINRPADISHAEHSHDESDRLSDHIGNRDDGHTGPRDYGSDRSPTPVPPAALPPPKPEHLDYREKFVLRGHIRGISAVQFSPDCSMIASAGMLLSHVSTIAQYILTGFSAGTDAAVKVWDTLTGRLVYTFEGHMAGISTLAWSPDGQWIATGSDDKTIRLWNVNTVRNPPPLNLALCDSQVYDIGSSSYKTLYWSSQLHLPNRICAQG